MSEKVVVFLPGWIGDAVMATPALRAIRECHTQARIAWVGKPYVLGALDGSPWRDEVIPAGTAKFPSRWIEPWTAAKAIRTALGGRPDKAVLLSNSMRTGLMATFSGAKERIGQALHGRGFLLTRAIAPRRDAGGSLKPFPILAVYNDIAMAAGTGNPGSRMELFTTKADEARVEAVWTQSGFNQANRVVGIHAGAAFGAAKLWPLERFAQVAARLARRGHGVIVIGGPAEAEAARKLVGLADHPLVRALAEPGMPPLSLGLSKAVVRRLDLLLTTDSGPRHFASAFGRPVVTLFGPTHIAWTETWQKNAFHIAAPVPCGPCQMRVCPQKHHQCMTRIESSMVAGIVETILDGGRPLPAPPGEPGIRAWDPPLVPAILSQRRSA